MLSIWHAIPIKSHLNVKLAIKIFACGGNQMLMLTSRALCCKLKYYSFVSEISCAWYQKYFVFGIRNILRLVSEILCVWYQKYFVFDIRSLLYGGPALSDVFLLQLLHFTNYLTFENTL